ncbi:MAG TPA: hypothetical protein VKK79_02170 [Candidatus Lokiarchaeia archaeon]|nr:hypothetical protein [Candidatus Lokiarchaeia archaeon]
MSSSYEKGIEKLLQNSQEFESIILEYICRVNAKFYSNVFPSTQLAKVIMNKLQAKKTKFPVIHKIVREILKKWEESEVCEHVRTTKYSRSRSKTKEIYKFPDPGLAELKERLISYSIDLIQNEDLETLGDENVMQTREEMINKFQEEFENFFEEVEEEGELEELDEPSPEEEKPEEEEE